jgi:hypothetical protein
MNIETIITSPIHVLDRVIVAVLSESVVVFAMGASWRGDAGRTSCF